MATVALCINSSACNRSHVCTLLLDVYFIHTLPVPAASRHSRAACPVLDTGAGIQERHARGLDARVRGHDVSLVLD